MLHRIGTVQEVLKLRSKLPQAVYTELLATICVLNDNYGIDRDYLQFGGYALVAETSEDISAIKEFLNFETHPCEWAELIGPNGEYFSSLHLTNDDFSVSLFMPTAIVPKTLLKDLEEQK